MSKQTRPAPPKDRTAEAQAERGEGWAYGELTVDDVIAAAAALVRREGVARLTMRRLADELGMSTMSVYYYVKSKQEVLQLLIDHVASRMPIPDPDEGPWDERVRLLLRGARAEIRQYPGLEQAFLTTPATSEGRFRLQRALEGLLIEGGYEDPDERAVAEFVLNSNVYASFARDALETASTRGAGRSGRAVRGRMGDVEEMFELGLEIALVTIRSDDVRRRVTELRDAR